jgi:hypothetical protein
MAAILVGLPFVVAGLFCCFTIILSPLGIVLFILGALPLYFVDKRRLQWILRDQPLPREEGDEERSWE